MSKPIGVRIDTRQEETWVQFKEFVAEKYGKKHTVLGNELVKALQLYLELYEIANTAKKEPETQLVNVKAGNLEVKSLREVSYDLLNNITACRGNLEQIEDELPNAPGPAKDRLDKLRHALFKTQKLIEERLEAIR